MKIILFLSAFLYVKADIYDEFEEFPSSVWSDQAPKPESPRWSKEHYSGYPNPPVDDDKSIIQMVPGTANLGYPAHLHSIPFLLDGGNRLDIRYWLRSSVSKGSKLRIQTVTTTGTHETITTITSSSASNNSFTEASVTLPTKLGAYHSICVQGERENSANGGVAISSIYLLGNTFQTPAPTTPSKTTAAWTTTPEPEPSTPPTSEATTVAELTTTASTTEAEASTTTIKASTTPTTTQTTTTPIKTTTAAAETSTGVTITSTTQTTPRATTTTGVVTTPNPNMPIVYNFTNGNPSVWFPGHRHGGYWAIIPRDGIVPAKYQRSYSLIRESFYSGTVDLTSPFLRITAPRVSVEIEFWGNGNRDDPALLQLFTKPRNNPVSASPFFDMSTFINRQNSQWVKLSTSFPGTVGAELQVVIQGVLGQGRNTSIAISYLKITGVQEIPWSGSAGSLDYNGWTQGEAQGSQWILVNSPDHPIVDGLPPFAGTVLAMQKEIRNPGFATIDSPVIQPSGARQDLRIKLLLRGTSWSPVSLTLRVKTTTGVLDTVPFLDARAFGTTELTDWYTVTEKLPVLTQPFQVVVEGSVGYEPENKIFIAEVWLLTYNEDGSISSEEPLI